MGFVSDFAWGAATASYQIEGGAFADGKGLSTWDTFCRVPGAVYHGQTGDVACDHYHRFEADVALMAEIGLPNYRFSASWPRVMPEGTGAVSEKGLEFYDRLVDALLGAGITPWLTLFHWDYPQALLERGGWLNPDSSDWFADYAQVVAARLGDRVKHFFTMNEPQCFIGIGFLHGIHAPGWRCSRRDVAQMAHNSLLAHGKAVQVLRAGVPGAKVSVAPCGNSYYPADPTPENIEAARLANFSLDPDWSNSIAWWSDPMMLGHYPDGAPELFGFDMPRIAPGDMEIIHQPLDYYGQNIYASKPVESDGQGGWRRVPRPIGYSRNSLDWPNTPESLYWVPKFCFERYGSPIVISENGMACHDVVSLDGQVHDPNRIDYLHRYLRELRRAADDGVDIRGYFQWSVMDNFEWARGYDERLGLIYVDYQTQERIVKDSAAWYRDIIRANGQNL